MPKKKVKVHVYRYGRFVEVVESKNEAMRKYGSSVTSTENKYGKVTLEGYHLSLNELSDEDKHFYSSLEREHKKKLEKMKSNKQVKESKAVDKADDKVGFKLPRNKYDRRDMLLRTIEAYKLGYRDSSKTINLMRKDLIVQLVNSFIS